MSYGQLELPFLTKADQALAKAPAYNLKKFPFMAKQSPHMPQTESSVSVPPALFIRDDEGALWTLGFDYDEVAWRSGKWEYDIVRNGRVTGEFGRVIEAFVDSLGVRRVKIWGAQGWRTWNGTQFV